LNWILGISICGGKLFYIQFSSRSIFVHFDGDPHLCIFLFINVLKTWKLLSTWWCFRHWTIPIKLWGDNSTKINWSVHLLLLCIIPVESCYLSRVLTKGTFCKEQNKHIQCNVDKGNILSFMCSIKYNTILPILRPGKSLSQNK
jgi:hypothetical protein